VLQRFVPWSVAVVLGLCVLLGPARASSLPPRWSASACRARTAPRHDRAAEARLDAATGAIRVWIYDTASDAVIAERTVAGPRWRSSVGEPCAAMGIAAAEIARAPRGRLAVRVEVSVGDLCERRAPRCAVVDLR